jgi:hypothetical protein
MFFKIVKWLFEGRREKSKFCPWFSNLVCLFIDLYCSVAKAVFKSSGRVLKAFFFEEMSKDNNLPKCFQLNSREIGKNNSSSKKQLQS